MRLFDSRIVDSLTQKRFDIRRNMPSISRQRPGINNHIPEPAIPTPIPLATCRSAGSPAPTKTRHCRMEANETASNPLGWTPARMTPRLLAERHGQPLTSTHKMDKGAGLPSDFKSTSSIGTTSERRARTPSEIIADKTWRPGSGGDSDDAGHRPATTFVDEASFRRESVTRSPVILQDQSHSCPVTYADTVGHSGAN